MELEELKKKYAELGAEIEKIEKGQQGRWKPKYNETYFEITRTGGIGTCHNQCTDLTEDQYAIGNVFKTVAEAQARAAKIKIYWQLYDLAERLNNGEKIDWKDCRSKWYICLERNKLDTFCLAYQKDIGQIYCLDENFLDKALEEIRRR